MKLLKQVTRVFNKAMEIPIDDDSRIVLVSDCHRGDGSRADDFAQNEDICLFALNHYYKADYTYIEIGDGDELWENKKPDVIINAHREVFHLLKRFYEEKRLWFIFGNHDMVKRNPGYVKANFARYYDKREKNELPLFPKLSAREGLVLNYQGNKILLLHGHQVDYLNSRLWKLSRFLVRYFWRPLELFGISNPTSPAQNQEKKESVGRRLTEWVVRERHMLVAGHNHRPMFSEVGEPPYFNSGSWVNPRLITALEITEGKIQLVKWGIIAKEDGTLFIGREVLDGPGKLSDYFRSLDNRQRPLTILSKKDYDI